MLLARDARRRVPYDGANFFQTSEAVILTSADFCESEREVQKVQDRKELKESIDLINVPAEVKEAVKQKMTIKERAAEAAAPKAMEMEGFGDDSD